MRIVRGVGFCYHVEGGDVVDYYGDKLEDVYGDELSVFVVSFEKERPTLDLLGEVDVPLEA